MASKQHILRALCSHLLVLFSVFMGDNLSSQSTSGFLFFENKLSVWKFNKKQRICSQFHHVHKVVLHIFITFTLSNFLSSFFTILFNPSGQVIHMLKYYRMWFRLLRGANDTRKYKNRSFDSNISAKILVTLSL